MSNIQIFFSGLSIVCSALLCILVLTRRAHRVVPVFTVYVFVLFLCNIGTATFYEHFGFRSVPSYYAYWTAVFFAVFTRSLAIMELCAYELRGYRGIWALVSRGLSALAILFLVNATLDAWGQLNRLAIYGLTIQRDFDLAAIAVIATLLLVRRYYGLQLDALQRSIAIGISFFCTAQVVGNTALRNLYVGRFINWFSIDHQSSWAILRPQMERLTEVYGTVSICSVIVAMGIWCFALLKPMPEPSKPPVLLPVDVYRDLAPELNLRLQAFNSRLLEVLKP